jgi:capsular polysaccharide export protein
MNVAYVDPPYSSYFHALSAALVQRTGGKVVALLSSSAYRLYTNGDRSLVWPPGEVADPAPLPPDTEHAVWSQTVDARFLGVFWSAVAWFRAQFAAERTELCMVFSDARPFSLAAAVAARELGVRLMYFERGAYRFRTASLSLQGLNARFSLGRARAHHQIAGATEDEAKRRRPLEPGLRWRFSLFILGNALACTMEPRRRMLQHKRYAFAPYVRLAVVQWWANHQLARNPDKRHPVAPGAPVVVVPLQLPADSQMRLGSPFEGNQAFLDFVVSEVFRVAPGASVFVKRHPMDSDSYRMPRGAQAVGGNLERFFGLDPVFVCVNSTVGFEAASAGRPVLCFGPSFYTDTAPVNHVTPGTFRQGLADALADRSRKDDGLALKRDVLRWYQAPGDAWAFSPRDLERTADIVLQHCRAHDDAVGMDDAESAQAAPEIGAALQQVVHQQRPV